MLGYGKLLSHWTWAGQARQVCCKLRLAPAGLCANFQVAVRYFIQLQPINKLRNIIYKRLLFIGLALIWVACSGFKVGGINLDKAVEAGSDAYKAATLSEQEVQAMGKQSADELDKLNKIAPAANAYAKRLEKIVASLSREDGLKLNFKVYLVTDVNAFALPDGSVRVFAGLMDMMTDDEIYFVVGHEIGHVKNGDSADAYRVAYAASAARKGAAAVGGTAAALSASQFGALCEAVLNAQFSQSQESAADRYGLQLMKKYKRDTAAAVSALNKLAALGASGGFLSSHPDPKDRAAALEKLRK